MEGILEVVNNDDVDLTFFTELRTLLDKNVSMPTRMRALVLATPEEYRRLRKLPPALHSLGLGCIAAGVLLLMLSVASARRQSTQLEG